MFNILELWSPYNNASYKLGQVHLSTVHHEAIFFVGLAAVAAVLFAVYTIVQVQVGSGLKGSKDIWVWKLRS